MAEKQEIVHVVMRSLIGDKPKVEPVKVFDDRADARSYRTRYNKGQTRWRYSVKSVKKG